MPCYAIRTNHLGIHSSATKHRHRQQQCTTYHRPIADHAQQCFKGLDERIKARPAPIILDSGCGRGLSSQILAQRYPEHWVIALDQSKDRMKVLSANMTRLNMTPECVIADGMTWQPQELVDAVLLDAPCSATGTIRRRPDILTHQKAPDLAMLNRLQHGLLAQAATWLKPGGVLVYVTCSILKDEGEKIIQSAPPSLKPVPITSDDAPGFNVTNTNGDAIRLMPDALQLTPQNSGLQDPEDLDTRGNIPQGCDGFFIAKFIKV